MFQAELSRSRIRRSWHNRVDPLRPLGRIVGVPSLWSRPGGVLQEHGIVVSRQVDPEQANFRVARYSLTHEAVLRAWPLSAVPVAGSIRTESSRSSGGEA